MRQIQITFIYVFFAVVTANAADAQSWKESLREFSPITITARKGYTAFDAPGGTSLKTLKGYQTIRVKASLNHEGKRYYMSEWSWKNLFKMGKSPTWLHLPGDTAPVEVAKVKTVPEHQPAESIDTATRLIEQIEERLGGKIQVFPKEISVEAPEGHRLLAAPDEEARVLQNITKQTAIGAKAAITKENGDVYYASTWSWNQAIKGSKANWTQLKGRVTSLISTFPELKKEPSLLPEISQIDSEKPLQSTGNPAKKGAPANSAPRIIALLIANTRYSSANIAQRHLDLFHPANDVELLASKLRQLHADVSVVTDAKRDVMLKAISRATGRLRKGDAFLFYYAGHGIQLDGKNYLAPLGMRFLASDAIPQTGVSLDQIFARLKGRTLSASTIILDCARKNPLNSTDFSANALLRLAGIQRQTKSSSRTPGGFAEITPPANTTVVFATQPGKFAITAGRPGNHSIFAEVLSKNLTTDMTLHEALLATSQRVNRISHELQIPWVSAETVPPFFLKSPARQTLPPDEATQQAANFLSRVGEPATSLAMAHLARSVRNQPLRNSATSALLFYLAYQAIPVPINSWGPFTVESGNFAPELQLSLDGVHLGLFTENSATPKLIVDRYTGKKVESVDGMFTSAYTTTEIKIEPPTWPAADPSIESVTRFVHENGTHAATPILGPQKTVAAAYDEGYERIYLAIQSKNKITIREFAATAPVEPNKTFQFAPNPSNGITVLAKGTTNTSPTHHWELTSISAAGEVQLHVDERIVFRREAVLHDWVHDASQDSLALLFEDQIVKIGVDGKQLATVALEPSEAKRSILGFSPASRRLIIQDTDPATTVRNIDLVANTHSPLRQNLTAHPQFAALSADGEWFFSYDESRRLNMTNLFGDDSALRLTASPTLEPLINELKTESEDESTFSSGPFQLSAPPLFEQLSDFATEEAPSWLPDLAECLAGFRLDDSGQIAWMADTKPLNSVLKQMQTNKSAHHQAWAEWFLENRLGALLRQ